MTDQAQHHADEARRILTLLDTGIGYPDEAIAAQVHATLAVAERLAEIAAALAAPMRQVTVDASRCVDRSLIEAAFAELARIPR